MKASLASVAVVLLSVLGVARANDQSGPTDDHEIRLVSASRAQVSDFVTGEPVEVGLTLHLLDTPKGPRVVAALEESTGAFVQLACPDSRCSIGIRGSQPAKAMSACYEERFGTYQALKLDSPGPVIDALNGTGDFHLAVPVLEGSSTRMVEFRFNASAVPRSFGSAKDTCEGDFWAQA